ncbi:hypothetical protein HK100_010475 [Physocladia obscura]|uniref:Uncharacterized protein n=1 Tax=Physocladia obscura TaxID=109957 RepID=A0AAD5T9N8_9FUNG|nr:hypothetical protein HK100_010475 [Physocladia obscura]
MPSIKIDDLNSEPSIVAQNLNDNLLLKSALTIFPNIDEIILHALIIGPVELRHFTQICPPDSGSLDETSKVSFQSPNHMIRCLVQYQSILSVKYQHYFNKKYPPSKMRAYNTFIDTVFKRLDFGTKFEHVSDFILDVLLNSATSMDFDFTRISYSSLDDIDSQFFYDTHDTNDESHDGVTMDGIPTLRDFFSTYFSAIFTPTQLSQLMTRKNFLDLFATSNKHAIIDAVGVCLLKLAKRMKNIWIDSDFWCLLEVISNSRIEDLLDTVLFGASETNKCALGLIRMLAGASSSNLDSTAYSLVDNVLRKFLQTERRRNLILMLCSEDCENPLLLHALRNGSYPMISFLTSFLSVTISGKLSVGGICPWALLQTAHTGTWNIFTCLVVEDDFKRLFDGDRDNLVGMFLEGLMLEEGNGTNRAFHQPCWNIQPSKTALLNSSFGNLQVFKPLLKRLKADDIRNLLCDLEIEWINENHWESFTLGQFDLAILSGYTEEALLILEVLTEAGMDASELSNPVILMNWLVWMIQAHKEPAAPSSNESDTKDSSSSTSSSFLNIQEILVILGEDGLDQLINNTSWPASLPFELYSRGWISPVQMTKFMDSPRFNPVYILPAERSKSSFLCWAAARFHVHLLAQYLPTVKDNHRILVKKTSPGGETWMHLLAHGFSKVKQDRAFVRMAIQCVKDGDVFNATDAGGKSVQEAWEAILDLVEKQDQAEVKRILAMIQSNCKGDVADVIKVESSDSDVELIEFKTERQTTAEAERIHDRSYLSQFEQGDSVPSQKGSFSSSADSMLPASSGTSIPFAEFLAYPAIKHASNNFANLSNGRISPTFQKISSQRIIARPNPSNFGTQATIPIAAVTPFTTTAKAKMPPNYHDSPSSRIDLINSANSAIRQQQQQQKQQQHTPSSSSSSAYSHRRSLSGENYSGNSSYSMREKRSRTEYDDDNRRVDSGSARYFRYDNSPSRPDGHWRRRAADGAEDGFGRGFDNKRG